ncbi:hypothetical protein Fcan01_12226 [Folsomia candida]|uniref:Uncharacterized protein n=1 Tax=Folsomia candida TaxID=158441 RepID=A0A226E700_FOLCA|nr:hypothetical protein Fcan01_12226 [Folsomia candida]
MELPQILLTIKSNTILEGCLWPNSQFTTLLLAQQPCGQFVVRPISVCALLSSRSTISLQLMRGQSVPSTVSVSLIFAECRWTSCQCQPLWLSVGGHSVSVSHCGRVSVDTVSVPVDKVSVPLIVSECHRTQCPYNMGVRHWVSSTVSVSATVAECRWTSVSVTHCGRVSVDTVSVSFTVAECQWTQCQCH